MNKEKKTVPEKHQMVDLLHKVFKNSCLKNYEGSKDLKKVLMCAYIYMINVCMIVFICIYIYTSYIYWYIKGLWTKWNIKRSLKAQWKENVNQIQKEFPENNFKLKFTTEVKKIHGRDSKANLNEKNEKTNI
jgi:hypothetical protein